MNTDVSVADADVASPVLQATIDSLSSHLAILDKRGTIISINAAWRKFARDNDFSVQSHGLGANYLDVCASATGADADEAPIVLQGLHDVLSGERDEFYLEYPCHSPTEQRWYALRATRYWNSQTSDEPVRVVVTHENISARKLTEIRLREETEVTATLYRIGQVVAGELDAGRLVEAIVQAAVELTGAHIGAFLPVSGDPVAPPFSFGAGVTDPDYAVSPLAPRAMFENATALRAANVKTDARFAAPGVPASNAPLAASNGAIEASNGAFEASNVPFEAANAGIRAQNSAVEAGVGRDATQGAGLGALRTPFGAGGAVASYLATPIIARSGQWLGALFLAHPRPDRFGHSAASIVRGLAGQAALSLENARLYEAAQSEKAALAALEERHRLVTELIPQIVWMTDASGEHLYFNQRWYDFTGLDRTNSLGHGWANPLHPDDEERSRARWQHSLDTGDPYEIEYRFRRYDGEYHWFLGRALPLHDEGGRIVKWFGTCTDVDEAKRAAAERAQVLENEARARREAENANRLKDEFLAVVSHELRTPLTPILGWLDILKTDGDDPAMRAQAYGVIERNTRAQTQIVNDLLDVSRIISGKLKLDLRPIDLREAVEGAIETVKPTALVKGVALEAELPNRAAQSLGDLDRLQQVAWNLISNAVKFTPRGGTVNVSLARVESDYVIEVRDSGAGIAPEFVPFVFERFRQADASSTRATGGLGLGLSIVRHLVEQHGGEASVESQGLGEGATFRVRLPIAPLTSLDAGPDEASGEPAPEEAQVAREALRGARVLVVDDEADAREMLKLVLSRYGAQIEVASSAETALGKFREFRPDILLSDIGMPDEDGYSLIQSIRALPAQAGGQTPAIALTAYARAEDRARALEAGYQTHLAKPIAPAILVEALCELLESSPIA